ncbi:MAG TPA: VCBS repeat-containing protein [Anaerolineae bacterium]|nr:VCBS repeat-containing protein [Anaerolineae bacterium]
MFSHEELSALLPIGRSLQKTTRLKLSRFDMMINNSFSQRAAFILFFLFILTGSLVGGWLHSQPTAVQAAPAAALITLGGTRIKHAAPAAADFNGDGYKEIVVGTYDGRLFILSTTNGTDWATTSTQAADALNSKLPANEHQSAGRIESAPAIGDVDNDGALEIVVTTGGFPDASNPANNRHGGIIVYEVDNNMNLSLKPGWPFLALDAGGQGAGSSTPDGIRDGIWSSPALGDIDGGGDLEIVVLGLDRQIYALKYDGSPLPGWPVSRSNGDPILRGGWSSPALADLDDDGLLEIIVGTDSPPWNGDDGSGPFPPQYDTPDYAKSTVWAVNGNGSLVPGWPTITEQWVQSSPAVGDIDGDGELEVVVGAGEGIAGSGGRKVYAWERDGSAVSGWPRTTNGNMRSSPALADLDNDGVLDVIIGCGTEASDTTCYDVYAWRGDGGNVPGFPARITNHKGERQAHPYPPVAADIDGDGRPEIILAPRNALALTIVEHDGSRSGDFSRQFTPGSQTILAPPLVADVDNDGKLETILAGESLGAAAVYIFDESGSAGLSAQPWPAFQRDAARTGLFLPPVLDAASEVRFFHQQGSGNTAVAQFTIHNRGGDAFNWQINESIAPLTVSSTTGTVTNAETVTLSLDASGFAAGQWHTVGTMTLTGSVDGQAIQGSPQNIVVYLYVGDISQIFLPALQK